MPGVVLDGGEIQVLGDLGGRHGALDVLLVGKYQHRRLPQVLKGMTGKYFILVIYSRLIVEKITLLIIITLDRSF